MKYLSIAIFTLMNLVAFGQSGVSVTYNIAKIGDTYYDWQPLRYIQNDSFAFQYRQKSDEDDVLKRKKVFTKRMYHHATFIDKSNLSSYNHVDWPKGNKVLLKDTIKSVEWVLVKGTKKILGYQCYGALNINSNNDSTLVWYTSDLGDGIGFENLNFSLGMPLEFFSQELNRHYLATKIKKGDFKFNLPAAKIVNRIDYVAPKTNGVGNFFGVKKQY